METNIAKICRLCLVDSKSLRLITKEIRKRFQVLTQTELSKSEDYPSKLCQLCADKLEISILYRNFFLDNQKSLEELLPKTVITVNRETEELIVKEEATYLPCVKQETALVFPWPEIEQSEHSQADSMISEDDSASTIAPRSRRSLRKRVSKTPDYQSSEDESVTSAKQLATAQPSEDEVESSECTKIKCKGGSIAHRCNHCKKLFYGNVEVVKKHLKKHAFEAGNKKCPHCERAFKTYFQYWKHIEIIHSGSAYICDLCGMEMPNRIRMRLHMVMHGMTKRYHCSHPGCDKSFRYSTHKHVHQRSHSNEKPFLCASCPRTFTTNAQLRNHQRLHDGNLDTCPKCKSPFLLKQSLDMHIPRCDGVFRPFRAQLAKGREPVDASKKKQLAKIYKCRLPDCSEEFALKSTMKKHLIKVHKMVNTTLTCLACSETFEDKIKLHQHQKTHLEFVCKFCNINIRTQEKLDEHIAQQHDDDEIRPYSCDHCQAKFKRPEHLRSHITRVHFPERPFKCDQCAFAGAARYDLNKHMLSHQDPTNKCRFCSMMFKALASLKTHLRYAHQTDETYFCDEHNVGFKYLASFNEHNKSQH